MESKQVKTENDFKEAIVETIAFFDLFDYPCTVNEIRKHLNTKRKISDIISALNFKPLPSPSNPAGRPLLANGRGLSSVLDTKNGFYFLPDRSEIIKTRLARYNYSDKKFKRAIWVARIFKAVPWIKMIAVGNIIGAHNLKKEGDIDLFIITAKNRVWLTRFFCVSLLVFLNLRPKEGDAKDKICLSFFVSEDNLGLSKLKLKNDPYFNYWLAGLVPIYDVSDTYEKFIKANNWLKEFFPNWEPSKASYRRDAGKPLPKLYYYILDFLFGWTEGLMQKFQIKILPDNLKSLINKDTRVVVNNKVIKLYANDRRKEYLEKFYAKIKELNLSADKAGN